MLVDGFSTSKLSCLREKDADFQFFLLLFLISIVSGHTEEEILSGIFFVRV
jgi:hypothetical protein